MLLKKYYPNIHVSVYTLKSLKQMFIGCLVSTSVFKGSTENNPSMNGLLQSSMILNIIVEVTNHEIRYLLHY